MWAWYYYHADQAPAYGRKCPAIVSHVWSETMVNLSVLIPSGEWVSKTSVKLVASETDVVSNGHQCVLKG